MKTGERAHEYRPASHLKVRVRGKSLRPWKLSREERERELGERGWKPTLNFFGAN